MIALLMFAALSVLAPAVAAVPCQPMPVASRWLATQMPHWQATLEALPGYHFPAHLRVCRLAARWPFADPAKQRIYVAPLGSSNDAVGLIHEYLHVAFAGTPRGRDEAFIEALARRLAR